LIADVNDIGARSTKDPTLCTEQNNCLAVPGKEWQIARFNNIQEYSKITIPGFCYECKSQRPFIIDILRYFDFIIAAQGPYPSRLVSGDYQMWQRYGEYTRYEVYLLYIALAVELDS
jgi:hypothetical protein